MSEPEPTEADCRTPAERAAWRALAIAQAERDEARRECCRWMAEVRGETPEEHAAEMGWDCWNRLGTV